MRSPGLGLERNVISPGGSIEPMRSPWTWLERNVISPGGSIEPMRSPGLGLKEMLPLQVVRSNQCEVLDLA